MTDITLTVIQTSKTLIHAGCGTLSQAGARLAEAGVRGKAMVITHKEVNKLYGQMLKESLEEQGIKCVFIDIPSGEKYKQWNTVARILPILKFEQVDRSCAIGSLGGGVAGDLAGFLASIYMRGTKCFHVPTTLLAQVDSSLGGKTAVNYQQDKNLLGTFYQPQVIVADVNVLASLPPREFAAGMAEAVKTALLAGEEFLGLIEDSLLQESSKTGSSTWPHPIGKQAMAEIVARCLDFKGQVVAADVFDLSHRHQLNLGHTFAHAIEAATGFAVYNHGEAVALGLLCALRMSQAVLAADAYLENRLRAILRTLELPTSAPELNTDEIFKYIHMDKKRHDGKTRFVGLRAPGSYKIIEAPDDLVIKEALKAIT